MKMIMKKYEIKKKGDTRYFEQRGRQSTRAGKHKLKKNLYESVN